MPKPTEERPGWKANWGRALFLLWNCRKKKKTCDAEGAGAENPGVFSVLQPGERFRKLAVRNELPLFLGDGEGGFLLVEGLSRRTKL